VGRANSRFTNLHHAALATLCLGLSFTWLPYPVVVLTSEVREFFPPGEVNTYIGYATAIGALFAITVPPIVGAWSDRVTTRFGRRRPFMVTGVLLGTLWLFVMMTAHSYTQLVIGHVIAQIFLNAAAAAYYAIIPDIVPANEFGKASGFLAGMQQTGALLGFVATFLFGTIHQTRMTFLVMTVVLVLSLIPVLGVAKGGPTHIGGGGGPLNRRWTSSDHWTGDFG
jgi:MFS family permease